MAKHEIDLGLLLWTIERGAKPEAFGPGRTVVQLCLTDQIAKKRHWWVLNESGRCELCLEIPDQNVDLFLEATLPDMIYVYQGDLTVCAHMEPAPHGRRWPAGSASVRSPMCDRQEPSRKARTNDGQARKLPDFVTESSSAAPWRNTASAFAV